MKGTEKQIKWAEDIKAEVAAIMNVDDLKDYIVSHPKIKEEYKAYVMAHGRHTADQLDAAMKQALAMMPDDAEWWIARGRTARLEICAAATKILID